MSSNNMHFSQIGFRDFSTTDAVNLTDLNGNACNAFGIIAETEFQTDSSGSTFADGFSGDSAFHARTHAPGTYLMRFKSLKFLSGTGIVLLE